MYNNGWEEIDDFFPPYIVPNSPEIANWERKNPAGWKQSSPSATLTQSEGHAAAAAGDVETLKELALDNEEVLHMKDKNGWEPIHEAVRGGHVEAVRMLVENGADINSVTNFGAGVSPYNMALKGLSAKHPVSELLKEFGAVNIGPEL